MKRSIEGFLVDAEKGVVIGPSGRCVGHRTSYGYMKVVGRNRPARLVHRLIWESVHGPIPAGLQINHINGIKADNRIENLELVTPHENCMHAFRTGLSKRLNGERNSQAKLTNDQVRQIKVLLSSGVKQCVLAATFGVDPSTISFISTGRKWGSV